MSGILENYRMRVPGHLGWSRRDQLGMPGLRRDVRAIETFSRIMTGEVGAIALWRCGSLVD